MIPYAPSTPYQRNATVADLMMQAGNQQAQAQLQKGAVWGRALGNVGEIASGAIQDYQAQKQKQAQADAISKRDQAFVNTLQQNGGKLDIVDAVRIYGPKDGPVIAKGLYDFQQSQGKTGAEAMQHFPGVAAAYLKLSPGLQKAFYESQLRPTAIAGGLFKEQDLPAQWSPEVNSGIMSLAGAFAPAEAGPKTREVVVMNPDGTKTTRIVEDKPGQEFTSAAEPKKPDTRSLEVRLADALASGDTATASTLKSAIAQAAAAGRAPKEAPIPGDNKDDVSFLMNGGTAEKLPISVRSAAVAEAKKSGGVDGTGFVPMSGQQQNKFNDLMDLRNKAVRLSELLSNPEVSSRLGPLMGRVVDWTKELPGVGQDTTVKEAFDLFKDLSDSELRKRSGAAISPGEYQRILGFTVASSKQPDSNKTNLNRMISTLTRDLKTLGADRLRLPGEAEPLQNGTRVPAPTAAPAVNPPDTVTYKGKTVPFSSLPPELQAVVMKARASGGR